jgi:uncharacterized membrane protein YcaP (DUF421 family)
MLPWRWWGTPRRASRTKFCHPEHVFGLTTPWWEIILRTAVVYVVVLVLLRTAGKRELGQMSPVDLVVILVIANAVQNAMTGGDNSLIGGVIAATTLVAVNTAFSRVGHRVPYLKHLFESQPTPLVEGGKLIKRNLERENVEEDELMMAVREHGLEDLAGVEGAYLERDGSISIIPKGAPGRSGSRHIRQFRQR